MEGAQDAQVILKTPSLELQLIATRPWRLAMRWLAPVLVLLVGLAALLLSRAAGYKQLSGPAFGLLLVEAIMLFYIQLLYPEIGLIVLGTLTLTADELLVELVHRPVRCHHLLPDVPSIIIHYDGYRGERVGHTGRTGIENFISFNNEPAYRFWMPDRHTAANLQETLRNWYLRRVPVQEYWQYSRIFLLERTLGHEQIQDYKELGISLS